MKAEDMQKLAKEEANKHKFYHDRKTHTLENGKEIDKSVMVPVERVIVLMPKQEAFLDPTEADLIIIKEHQARTNQSMYEFKHEVPKEKSLKEK